MKRLAWGHKAGMGGQPGLDPGLYDFTPHVSLFLLKWYFWQSQVTIYSPLTMYYFKIRLKWITFLDFNKGRRETTDNEMFS